MYLLSYLIFDFVCLTLSSADTHGIEKYARTYIRDANTHAHTHTQKNKIERLEKKVGKPQKSRGGIRKERKKKKKKRTTRKGRKRRRKIRGRGGERKKKERGRGMGLAG